MWPGELGLAGQQLHLGEVQVPETGSLDTKKESGLLAGRQVAWTPRRKVVCGQVAWTPGRKAVCGVEETKQPTATVQKAESGQQKQRKQSIVESGKQNETKKWTAPFGDTRGRRVRREKEANNVLGDIIRQWKARRDGQESRDQVTRDCKVDIQLIEDRKADSNFERQESKKPS